MKIRGARVEDCGQILKLLSELQNLHALCRPDIFKEGQAAMDKEEFQQMTEDPNRCMLVAEKDGIIFGMIEMEIKEIANPILMKRKVGLISSFIVKESMRNQGIGQQLFDEAIKTAGDKNLDSLQLNVWRFNEEAIHFYEKNGMKPLLTTMELESKMFHVKQ